MMSVNDVVKTVTHPPFDYFWLFNSSNNNLIGGGYADKLIKEFAILNSNSNSKFPTNVAECCPMFQVALCSCFFLGIGNTIANTWIE